MRKMWPLLAALVILSTACRLETNVTIDIADDGSGTFVTQLGLDEEILSLLESFGGSDELLTQLNLGDGTPIEPRVEGDMTIYAVTVPFVDVAELKTILDENQGQAVFDQFELDVNEDGALLIAKAQPLPAQDAFDPDSLPFDLTALAENTFSADIFVKLPGNITKHNADETMADGRLRWSISLTEPLDIEAESSFGGGSVPWLPIGIAALAVLGVGAFVVTRNREDTVAAAALDATEAPPAPMGFGEVEPPPELPPELPPQGS